MRNDTMMTLELVRNKERKIPTSTGISLHGKRGIGRAAKGVLLHRFAYLSIAFVFQTCRFYIDERGSCGSRMIDIPSK